MIKVRPYVAEDFDLLASWWNSSEENGLQRGMIPECSGGVVEDENGPVAFAFLFMSLGCGVGFIERLMTRPGAPPRVKLAACGLLVDFLSRLARANDYGIVYSTLEDKRMARLARDRFGFEVLAQDVVACAKTL